MTYRGKKGRRYIKRKGERDLKLDTMAKIQAWCRDNRVQLCYWNPAWQKPPRRWLWEAAEFAEEPERGRTPREAVAKLRKRLVREGRAS